MLREAHENRITDAGVFDERGDSLAQVVAHWAWLAGCLMAIPAFYLELLATSHSMFVTARSLYAVMATVCSTAAVQTARSSRAPPRSVVRRVFDLAIICGAMLSVIAGAPPWSSFEWSWKLAFMAMIASRIVMTLRVHFQPNRLAWLPLAGAMVLLLGGAGFYVLEPRVHNYAEGLWLAFESSATVGYGDIAPTTPASRIFAVFVVLLGYGLLSLVFARLAAWLIGNEERRLRSEMHRDIKALHEELRALRRECKGQQAVATRRRDRRASGGTKKSRTTQAVNPLPPMD